MRDQERNFSNVSRLVVLTPHEALMALDLTRMHLCTRCLEVAGPWRQRYEPRGPLRQLCSCERRSLNESGEPTPEPWPSFDFNQAVTLCYCCGMEPLTSGSRFSVWFCDECKLRVRRVNEELRFYLIPIGRHSFMAGLGLGGKSALDPEKIEAFVQRWGDARKRMRLLDQWSLTVRRQSVEMLRLGHTSKVSVVDYLAFPKDVAETKLTRFRGLSQFFSIEL